MPTDVTEVMAGFAEAAKAVYRLRAQTSDIVFADVKGHRGLRRFAGRGLARARGELAFEVRVHNLRVLRRFSHQQHHVQETNSQLENIAA